LAYPALSRFLRIALRLSIGIPDILFACYKCPRKYCRQAKMWGKLQYPIGLAKTGFKNKLLTANRKQSKGGIG